jgi:hypothetical protein
VLSESEESVSEESEEEDSSNLLLLPCVTGPAPGGATKGAPNTGCIGAPVIVTPIPAGRNAPALAAAAK